LEEYEQPFQKGHIPYKISLSPLSANVKVEYPYRFTWATKTEENVQASLHTVAVLASKEQDTLVRILREAETSQHRIHVLSKLLEPQQFAILSIDDLDTDLIINGDGQLRLTPNYDLKQYHWNSAAFSLRIPVKRYVVFPSDMDGQQQMKSPAVSLALQRSKNTLAGFGTSGSVCSPANYRLLVKGKYTDPTIICLKDDLFNIPHNSKDEVLNIWLYE